MEKVTTEFGRSGIDPNDKTEQTINLTTSIKLTVSKIKEKFCLCNGRNVT